MITVSKAFSNIARVFPYRYLVIQILDSWEDILSPKTMVLMRTLNQNPHFAYYIKELEVKCMKSKDPKQLYDSRGQTNFVIKKVLLRIYLDHFRKVKKIKSTPTIDTMFKRLNDYHKLHTMGTFLLKYPQSYTQ
jgi:hypothetical protein